MSAIPAWAYIVACALAPPLWGILAARVFYHRDRKRRAPPVDYSI